MIFGIIHVDLRQTELGLLIALDALLEHASVTAAARQLGISQPAMSAQLARLRRLFGDPLLTPSGRRLIPTTRALALRAPLRQRLRDLDALVRESAHFDPRTTERTFRLIGTDYVQAVIAPRLVVALATTAPAARLALLPFDPPAVWRTLEDDVADAALVTGATPPDARVRTGLHEDFVAIQRPGHPRGSLALTLDAFCAAEHVLVSPEGGGFTGAADRVLENMGRSRRVACSVPSFLLAPALVAASDLVCLLPRRLAVLHHGQVERYELPFPSPRFTVDLVWHPRRQNDPAHIWFRRIVADIVRAC
ncbi:MAG: LysR family transcriptional regulator [Pseudomonadota bacterium]